MSRNPLPPAPGSATGVEPAARPTRVRRRGAHGAPEPLVQIPVWGQAEPPAEDAPGPVGTEALLAGLNPEQRRAVMHGDGPLLVVAGAGTGKTQVITRRIAWLIATRRARPSEILALTFTDQAADEMQVRVDQLVPYGYTDTAISTFHAFGDRLDPGVRVRAGAARGHPGPVAARDRGVHAGAPVRVRPGPVPAARGPDEVPGRAGHPLLARQGRGRVPGGIPRACRAPGRRGRGGVRGGHGPGRRGNRGGGGRRRRAGGGGPEAGGARPGVRPLPGAPRRQRRHRLRGPGVARAAAPAGVAGGPRGGPAAVPVRAGGRVPGHEPGPGGAGRAGRAASSQRHRGGRRRPVHLQVPGRGDQQHPRVPGAVPEREDGRAAAELPVARPDPGRVVPPRPPQRPGPPGGPRRDRQEAGGGPGRGRCARGPPRGLRQRRGGGGLDRPGHRAPDRGGGPAAGRRHPRPLQCRRGRGPALAQPRGDPVAVLRHERPVCAARGQAAPGIPAGDRGPGFVGGRVCPRGVGAVRPGRRGPREHHADGAAAEPVRARGPRGGRPAAGDPAAGTGDPRRRGEAGRGPRGLRGAGPPAARGRGRLRVPQGVGVAQAARRSRDGCGRGGPVQHRALLRHRARPVGAARGRPRRVPGPSPADA